MSGVRLLVGTRKGAFTLETDGKRVGHPLPGTVASADRRSRRGRCRGPIELGGRGPHFGGWEIYHLKGSPADPNRLYASQSTGWFGQLIQRSSDGGKTWEPVGNKFVYDGVPGTHQWYDGTPHPWEFKRVWHLEPSLTDPDHVYAGVEDAAIFQTSDGGQNWTEMPGLRGHGSGSKWTPGAGGLGLHTIVLDPSNLKRMFDVEADQSGIAIGAHPGPDGGGRSLRASNRHAQVASQYLVHAEALGRHADR